MDMYFEIKEIKQRQEAMLSKLDTLIDESFQERVYDVDELADLLKVSRRTIFTWKKQGILPHTQVGGKIWVTEEQLKLFLNEHSRQS